MIWVIVALYVLAAVLPFVGLWRIFFSTDREMGSLVAHFNARGRLGTSTVNEIEARELLKVAGANIDAKFDLCIVGAGLVCGAVASIWSLFL